MKDYIMNIMDDKGIKTGLVIMASGLSTRYGRNKLIEELDNKPLIRWIIDTTEGLFDQRVVVTRSEEVKTLCEELSIDCIYHALPNRNDTVRLGLTHMMRVVDFCFFTPADQPLISRDTILRLIDEAKKQDCRIIRTSSDTATGSPVGFSKMFFDELLMLPEKKGGNYIANKYKTMVSTVRVEEYELIDIDTISDLEQIKKVIVDLK